MAFPALLRPARIVVVTMVAVLLAAMFVAVTPPVSAAAEDPDEAAFAAAAGHLPVALAAAALVEAGGGGVTPSAPLSGTVSFPAGTDLSHGRTFVAAYAPGADAREPLAAAAVAADGSYVLAAPVGDVLLAVVSEGRAVQDRWGVGAADPASAGVVAVPAEGAVHDVTLDPAAAITGTVTVPPGASLAGGRVAVAVYPAGGDGRTALAANLVTDSGSFAVGGLPAGDYRVAAVSTVPGAVSEWWDDAPGFATAATVALTATGVRPGVHIALQSQRLLETTAPTVSGTPVVGQTLRAVPGAWTTGTVFTYRWYANGVAIAKASGSALLIPAALAGKRITVRVTGSKVGYTAVGRMSVATAAVLRPLVAPRPTIAGTPTVGQKLTARPGTWTAGARLTYQWYIDGVAVPRATGAVFAIPSAAARKTITVVVRGTRAGYATIAQRSRPTAAIRGVLAAPTPRISGSAIVGSRLSAVPGTWTSGTRVTYQWYLNGRPISRATGSTLVVTAAMAKARISVKVTGTKSGYLTAARVSAKTAAVAYPARTKPVSAWNCPAWAPIKGNADSGIYHVPSGRSYAKTKPESCFSTEAAAVKAGFRKAKR